MPRGTKDLEHEAVRIVGRASKESRPNAGHAGLVTGLIRKAYERGGFDTALALAHAYQLFLESDDLDALRDALTDLLPPDYVAPNPPAEGPARI